MKKSIRRVRKWMHEYALDDLPKKNFRSNLFNRSELTAKMRRQYYHEVTISYVIPSKKRLSKGV